MELDEMRQKWAEYDRKLDSSIRLNQRILVDTYLGKARKELRWLIARVAIGIATDVVLLIALGNFLFHHSTQPEYLTPAAFLFISVLVSMITLARQMKIILELDYSKPIATLQKELEQLAILRIRTVQAIFVMCPLLWMPLLIVAVKGFLGVDIYRILPGSWIVANQLFGVLFVLAIFGIARWYSNRMAHSPTVQNIMRDMAGDNLNAAKKSLATLAEFELETPEP